MTWTKLSDDWSDDTWTLSDAAYRLHTDGLVWSNRKLLDCRIPKDDLPRASKRAESVPELLEAGYWEDGGDCYLIVHHGAYQRTREQVLARQSTSRANGAKGGRPASVPRERFTPINPVANPLANPVVNPRETQRDGTGQDRDSLKGSVTNAHASSCAECQRRLAFSSGPCPLHAPIQETA